MELLIDVLLPAGVLGIGFHLARANRHHECDGLVVTEADGSRRTR